MPFMLNRTRLWQYDNPTTVKKNLRDAVTKSTFRGCDRAFVAGNYGKIVAIDIETGAWEMDINEVSASMRLEARCPDAQIRSLENWRSLCSSIRCRSHLQRRMIVGNVNAQYVQICCG
jgi:hypothetical protein